MIKIIKLLKVCIKCQVKCNEVQLTRYGYSYVIKGNSLDLPHYKIYQLPHYLTIIFVVNQVWSVCIAIIMICIYYVYSQVHYT